MVFSFNINTLIAAQAAIPPSGSKFFHGWWLGVGGVLLLIGIACDVIVLARFAKPGQFKVPVKSWGLREVSVVAAALLGLLVISNGIYAAVGAVRHADLLKHTELIIPVELTLRVGALAGFVVYLRHRNLRVIPALGIDATAPHTALKWGLIFGLASLPPVALIIFASESVCRLIGLDPSDQPIAELFLSTQSPALLVCLILFAIGVAPLFEEVFFRGFAYPALKQRWGAGRALVVVSAVFALSHFHAPSVLPLFGFALGLGLAYELTGSLIAPVTMHAFFNTVMVVKLLLDRSAT
jgi:uncharacterized protein